MLPKDWKCWQHLKLWTKSQVRCSLSGLNSPHSEQNAFVHLNVKRGTLHYSSHVRLRASRWALIVGMYWEVTVGIRFIFIRFGRSAQRSEVSQQDFHQRNAGRGPVHHGCVLYCVSEVKSMGTARCLRRRPLFDLHRSATQDPPVPSQLLSSNSCIQQISTKIYLAKPDLSVWPFPVP